MYGTRKDGCCRDLQTHESQGLWWINLSPCNNRTYRMSRSWQSQVKLQISQIIHTTVNRFRQKITFLIVKIITLGAFLWETIESLKGSIFASIQPLKNKALEKPKYYTSLLLIYLCLIQWGKKRLAVAEAFFKLLLILTTEQCLSFSTCASFPFFSFLTNFKNGYGKIIQNE